MRTVSDARQLSWKSLCGVVAVLCSVTAHQAHAAEAKVLNFSGGTMDYINTVEPMTTSVSTVTTGYTGATWDASNGVKINVTPGTATVGFGSFVPEVYTGPGSLYLFRVTVKDQAFNTIFDEEFDGWNGSSSQSGGITTGTYTTTAGRTWKTYFDAPTTLFPPFAIQTDGSDVGIDYPMDGDGPFSVLAATQFTIPPGVTSIYVNVAWTFNISNGGASARTFSIGFQNAPVPPEQLFSFSAPPSSPPGAPTLNSLTPGNQQLSVAFTAGSAGSSAITDYEYSLNSGSYVSAGTTSSPFIISGLTNGTSYSVVIRAVSSVGNGTASNSLSGTPATVPDAPTNIVPTAGNAQISVAYTAPASNGGSAITDYEVTPDNGGNVFALASTSNPLLLIGLTNGTTYNLKLRAVNAAGAGAWSAQFTATPRTVPGAPTGLIATEGNQQLSVSFTAPVSNGGSAITDYEYSLNSGAFVSAGSTSSPIVISGLTNGTSYSVQLRAVNVAGAGAASSSASGTPRTVPGAPSGLIATPGNQQVSIAFTAPVSNGGAAISNYEYSLDGGANWNSAGTAVSPVVVTGLTNGTSYTVELRAVNAAGSGAASSSVSATPRTVPSAPVISSVTPGDTKLTVAFTASSSNGGATITDYEYSIDSGSNWISAGTTSPFEISGLTNGATYSVTLRAINVAGASAASAPVGGSPRALPGAPTALSATPGNQQVSISFTAPSDGGAPITDYEFSLNGGTTWTSTGDASSPIVLTGLTNGTQYNVLLRAVNAAGAGPASASVQSTPRTIPGAPAITSVTRGDTRLTVAFTAPASNGGAAITDYEYSLDAGISWTSAGTTSPFVIRNLLNFTTYAITLRAVNVAGNGPASSAVEGTPLPPGPSRVVDSVEAPGVNCPGGGIKLVFGMDSDHSGALDANEITSTRYVCSGQNSLARTRVATAEECAFGGNAVLIGVDDNANGTLEDAEVDNATLVCNGEDGFLDANSDGVDDRTSFTGGGGCTSTGGDFSWLALSAAIVLVRARRRASKDSSLAKH